MSPAEEAAETLRGFGIDASAGELESRSPIDGQLIGALKMGDAGKACTNAAKAFLDWRLVPDPGVANSFGCSARSSGPRRSRLPAS